MVVAVASVVLNGIGSEIGGIVIDSLVVCGVESGLTDVENSIGKIIACVVSAVSDVIAAVDAMVTVASVVLRDPNDVDWKFSGKEADRFVVCSKVVVEVLVVVEVEVSVASDVISDAGDADWRISGIAVDAVCDTAVVSWVVAVYGSDVPIIASDVKRDDAAGTLVDEAADEFIVSSVVAASDIVVEDNVSVASIGCFDEDIDWRIIERAEVVICSVTIVSGEMVTTAVAVESVACSDVRVSDSVDDAIKEAVVNSVTILAP